MSYIIFSRSSGNSLKLEGQGYSDKKETEKYIKLFKARKDAFNKIQKEFSIDFLEGVPEYYAINATKLGIKNLV